MIRFVRKTFSVLDDAARLRFIAFALCSVVVAAVEALGVATMVPLTEVFLGQDERPALVDGIDRIVDVSSRGQAAAALGVIVLVAFTAKSAMAIALLRWAIGNSLQQEARIARNLFARYLGAPITYHHVHNSAELQRTLNESLLVVFRRSLPWVMASAADAFTLAAIAVVVVLQDPSIAGLAIAYFLLVGLVYQRWIGGRHKIAARRAHEEVATRYQQVQEPLHATKDLAVLHREGYFVDRFYQTKLQLANVQRQLLFYQLLPRQFLDLAFVLGAGLLASYVFTSRPMDDALVAVGLFLTAGFRLVAPLNRVMSAVTVSRTAEPAIDQVIEDLATLDEITPPAVDEPTEPIGPCTIELRDVWYRYRPELPDVLQGVTLTINPGDDIAIVGSTGAGKTTLLDIVLGLLEPERGEVLVNGLPMAACRRSWHRSIGYVPQQVMLLDDTIRANVAFGVEDASIDDEQVWNALRLAQMAGFVTSLEHGLDTPVGELGSRLSGGQRQRLGLARALYHRPTVLVLDEATSSLDADTEGRILATIADLHGSLTIITVTHRLSTLSHCDRLYFLRGGRVGSVGTFDEVRAEEPEFARLVQLAEVSATRDEHFEVDGAGELSGRRQLEPKGT